MSRGLFRQPPQPQQPRPSVIPALPVSANQTATPGTASLTLTAFAPTVLTPRLVTIGKATLTTATFAPTVSTPRLATVGKASLVLTSFAPTVSVPRLATVGKASLTTTTFAPSVQTPRLVIPGVAGLTLTSFAPTVSVAGGSVSVTPDTAVLALTTYVPLVAADALLPDLQPAGGASRHGIVVIPKPAHLYLRPYRPTVRIEDDDLAILLAA